MFLLCFLWLAGPQPAAHAAGIVVNSAADDIDGSDGECTLREAITAANSNTASGATPGECAAGAGPDTITFAADYTITLGSQLPNVTTEMTITGNGAANTIIQASTCNPVTLPGGCTPATNRLFEVTAAGNLTLDGVTARHGRCSGGCTTLGTGGGGILNGGTLTVTNTTLSSNEAIFGGGIRNSSAATLTITNSTLSGNTASNGGGIYSEGTVTVTNSTLAGNNAGSGGGAIRNVGTITVTSSTLAGNTATHGGGINSGGTVTVTNSTLSGNTATVGGGGIRNDGTVTVTNSTFAGNTSNDGGGILNLDTATVTNSLFVAGFPGVNCVSLTLGASNIVDDHTCGSATVMTTAEIKLGPLQNNGGPTQTHALLPDSAAIDFIAADCTVAPINGVDQRGISRPQGAACDAGAFEATAPQAGPAFVVNDPADTDDGACSPLEVGVTNCTLREAINAANAQPGANTITFAADYTITLAGSQLPAVTTEMTITGNGAANTIIQANAAPGTATYRVLQVTAAGNLTLDGVTVRHGRCAGGCATLTNDGGGALNQGTLAVTNSALSGNTATFGGGIRNDGTATVTSSTLSGNTATYGGGIYNHGTATVTNSTFSGNSAGIYGGGIRNASAAIVTVTNSTFSGNSSNEGGGIYNTSTATVTNSTFAGNSAVISGGGIRNDSPGIVTVTNSLFVAGVPGYNCDGLTLDASNIANDATCGSATVMITAEIKLGPLQNNGGPTQTHALLTDSAAIDFNTTGPATDQRGTPRPFGTGYDAGAYEYDIQPPSAPAVYMSAKTSGTTEDGVDFDNSDILKWDGTNWSKVFDGTDAHLDPVNKPKHNVNAFYYEDDEIIMSFAQNGRKVGDLPDKVDGMDLVRWDGSSFVLWFDGSDVGLTKKTPEKIDGLHLMPGDAAPLEFGGACEQYLLISTQGAGAVPAYGGGQIKFSGEDVLGFCMTNWGEATAGFWHLVLDGSAKGLPKNSLDSISGGADGSTLYFTTSKTTFLGGHSMVFAYDGNTFSGPHFVAADNGLGQMVDGLDVVGELE